VPEADAHVRALGVDDRADQVERIGHPGVVTDDRRARGGTEPAVAVVERRRRLALVDREHLELDAVGGQQLAEQLGVVAVRRDQRRRYVTEHQEP
jgi:hypothetical protein